MLKIKRVKIYFWVLPQEDQMIRELERKLLGQLNAGITLMKTTTNKSRM